MRDPGSYTLDGCACCGGAGDDCCPAPAGPLYATVVAAVANPGHPAPGDSCPDCGVWLGLSWTLHRAVFDAGPPVIHQWGFADGVAWPCLTPGVYANLYAVGQVGGLGTEVLCAVAAELSGTPTWDGTGPRLPQTGLVVLSCSPFHARFDVTVLTGGTGFQGCTITIDVHE